MNRLLLLTFLCLFSGQFIVSGQQCNFHNYTVRDGLAQSQVYALLQDHRGYLWMGTRGGGITCFDGTGFKTFTEKDGLSNSYVHKIRQDSQQQLWIATNNGLSVFNGQRFRSYRIPDSEMAVWVYDIAFDQQHAWLATGKGIYRFENGKFIPVYKELGLAEMTVNSLVIDKNGSVWFGAGKGLFRIDRKNGKYVLKDLSSLDSRMGNAINVLTLDAAGILWIGTYGDGAYCYENGRFSRIDYHHELYTRTVLDIFADSANDIWFATLNHGVIHYRRSSRTFTNLTENQGLSNNHVRSILQDNGGNFWFGTSGGGVCHYFGKQFTTFDKSSGLGGNYIYSVFRDSKRRLWVGTSQRGVSMREHGSFTIFDQQNGFANVKVKSIAEGKDGVIYLGTDGQGIYAFDGASFRLIPKLAGIYVRGMQKDQEGSVWIATAGNGLIRMQPDGTLHPETERYTVGDGLLQSRLTALFVDGKRVWYGTENNGVGLIENGKSSTVRIRKREGLRSGSIRSVIVDHKGVLWIGTTDAGIASVTFSGDKPVVTSYDHTSGLHSSNIYLLTTDRAGNLIAGSESGLDHLFLDERRHPLSVRHYGYGEGFTGIETCQNAVFNDPDGGIWFGTINGLSHYNPANAVKNTHAPITGIVNVRLFYENLSETPYRSFIGTWNNISHLKLPYDQNHLSFEFKAINFSNPQAVRYRWKLEGFDAGWSPASAEHSIVYSNISPGNYTFLVKACNEDGVWNPVPAKIIIEIAAPFWQSKWFVIFVVFVLSLSIAGLFHLQSRRLRKKAMAQQQRLQLEKEVVELEQKALRLQMNPHFIFNALNSIQSQIGTGSEQQARYYLAKFSRLMRQILDNSRSASISLEEEIRTLENYLLIEQFCNGNRFDYRIDTDERLEPDFIHLPPMLLQPFVENAIKHGFRFNDPAKRGKITIVFRESGNMLECIVQDNGIGRERSAELNRNSKETYHRSTALLVTQERLDLLSGGGRRAYLEIMDLINEQGTASGTRVLIRIPV